MISADLYSYWSPISDDAFAKSRQVSSIRDLMLVRLDSQERMLGCASPCWEIDTGMSALPDRRMMWSRIDTGQGDLCRDSGHTSIFFKLIYAIWNHEYVTYSFLCIWAM